MTISLTSALFGGMNLVVYDRGVLDAPFGVRQSLFVIFDRAVLTVLEGADLDISGGSPVDIGKPDG